MLVFIDSSVLCTDYYMRGTYFELLKKESTIVLSEIVIAEVKNKHRETIEKNLRIINNEINTLNKSLFNALQVETNDILLKELADYDEFIDMFLIESGMTIAESYPQIEHEKIVTRALQRKKPFTSDGKNGYRDYLVWRSFLELVRRYSSEDVYFITLNKKDFSDTKDDKKLHPDLIEEYKDLKIDPERVQYWTSLREFVDKIIKPRLYERETQQNIANSLMDDGSNFVMPLEELVFNKMIGFDLNNSGVNVVGENPSISAIEEIDSMEIENVSNISDEEYLLEIQYDIYCTVETFMLKSELHDLDEQTIVPTEVVNTNWNDHYALLQEEVVLNVTFEVIYDTRQKVFSTLEISEINDYYCPYCAYD